MPAGSWPPSRRQTIFLAEIANYRKVTYIASRTASGGSAATAIQSPPASGLFLWHFRRAAGPWREARRQVGLGLLFVSKGPSHVAARLRRVRLPRYPSFDLARLPGAPGVGRLGFFLRLPRISLAHAFDAFDQQPARRPYVSSIFSLIADRPGFIRPASSREHPLPGAAVMAGAPPWGAGGSAPQHNDFHLETSKDLLLKRCHMRDPK